MPGDETPTMGELAAHFAATLGVTDRSPVDWESVSARYAADARLRDARRRYEAFVANAPEFAETDWSRPMFEPNRTSLERLIDWRYSAKGILASGPTGRGKTRAIVALFRRLACDEGRDVRYYFAGDWFAALQAQLNYGRDEARSWVESCARRPLVIIDDLGQEAMQTSRTDWAQAWLFRFLDLRIGHGLPLIVSTNLSSREMAARANDVRGDPLVRRLTDLCEIVKFV